ncbi:MAG: DUF2202 domain-containing protein [Prolixibacteraceae bacterium]
MKTRIFLSSMAILAVLVLPACSEGVVETVEPTIAEEIPADLKDAIVPDSCLLTGTIADAPVPACAISGTVTDAEASGLLLMREEEKMARDVYAYLYEKYNIPVFKNITKSENVHMTTVLKLITGFNVTDNSSNNPGEFTDNQINERYLQLIKMGDVSVIEALKVGVLIEQTDIADLKTQLEIIQNNSIKTVYTNLLAGSNAHLKAFIWNLKVRGVVYP